MNIKTLTLVPPLFDEVKPKVKQLHYIGRDLSELFAMPRVAIVGSRKATAYGRQVTEQLARELAEQGVVIISGLAIGIDAIAHEAALEAGGICLAVLPSPLDNIVPRWNARLAKKILEQGGALISEYPVGSVIHKGNFVARNRLVAASAQAIVITEAGEKSGSRHTAEFALELGRDVFAVPGPITSPNSVGTNNLLKSGASPVTSANDILFTLGLNLGPKGRRKVKGSNPSEQLVLDLLQQGIISGDELLVKSMLDVSLFNQTIVMLEITGKVRPLGANQWCIA